MSSENERTLEVYQEKASVYLNTVAEHDRLDPVKAKLKREKLEDLIKINFSLLPKYAKVFEIGSGNGNNAKFIESLGFEVTASDTADGFIEEIKKQGINTVKFNVIKDSFLEKYFAIFCWRVFVHFTKEDAQKVIQFEGVYHMGAERYYSYFKQKELDDIIKQTKFKIESFHKEGGNNNDKWLVYVLKN